MNQKVVNPKALTDLFKERHRDFIDVESEYYQVIFAIPIRLMSPI